ncbi:MAG: hypothetical protein PHX38_06900 [Sulfuricella sp.]|nr:hypothetical protein [Sulfuricella sp.]
MDIRMPEVFGPHHHHEPEHRKGERRGLNALEPYLFAAVLAILIAVAAFSLWVVAYFFVGYLGKLFS